MAILITGGAGFIGSRLLKSLAGDGHNVVCVYRQKQPEPHRNVYPVCSRLESKELLAAPLRGVRTVVHLAWDPTVRAKETYKSNAVTQQRADSGQGCSENLQSLLKLVAAMEMAQTPRLIFVSAVGVNQQATDYFLQEKYEAERVVLNSAIEEKYIFRLAAVYSERGRDNFFQSIRNLLRVPGFYPMVHWDGPIFPVSLEEVVSFLSWAALVPMPESVGVYHLWGRKGYQLGDVIRMLAARSGSSAKIALTSTFAKLMWSILENNPRGEAQNFLGLKHYLGLSSKTKVGEYDNCDAREAFSWYHSNCRSLEDVVNSFQDELQVELPVKITR